MRKVVDNSNQPSDVLVLATRLKYTGQSVVCMNFPDHDTVTIGRIINAPPVTNDEGEFDDTY